MLRMKLAAAFGLVAIATWVAGVGTPADLRRLEEPWPTASPESQGFDSAELAKVFDLIKNNRVDFNSLLIFRNGNKVLEAYFYPFDRTLLHDLASVTKSITSLLVGIAVDKGFIKSVQEPALSFFPDRTPATMTDRMKRLTLEHLLTMTSGFCGGYTDGEAQPGEMRRSPDGVRFMLEQPLIAEPGAAFSYCSLAPHLLSAVLTRAAGMSALEFARRHLFGPLGIERVVWPEDRWGNTFGWGDLHLRPIDLAKIGQLLMNKGLWNGTRIVSEDWIGNSAREHVRERGTTAYGYLWWLELENPGLFEGRGRGGQRLTLWPRRGIMVVMMGNGGRDPGEVGAIIGRALKSDAPLPENPEALRLLARKIREAESAPGPRLPDARPPAADWISGAAYAMEPNPLGMEAFSLEFGKAAEASLKLSVRDAMSGEVSLKTYPVGLDGVYRFSDNSNFGLPAAVKGGWSSPRRFDLVINEPAAARAFDLRIEFEVDAAEVTISERTGLFDSVRVRARAGRGPLKGR